MRQFLRLNGVGAVVLGLALTVPAPAFAGLCQWFPALCNHNHDGPSSRVPEIDPGTLRATLTVLAGGVLLLVERRRRS